MYRRNQFLVKVKATSTSKLLDSLPRNDALAELSLVNSMWLTAVIWSENYQHHHHAIYQNFGHE
jgi:hypothetical protein